jgi:hypothetical protein
MNRLELAWSAWRALPRTERAQFLVLLREAYCREREAVVRENGGSAHGVRVSRLTDLTLREDDLRAAMTERSPGVRSWRLGSPLARFPGGPLLGRAARVNAHVGPHRAALADLGAAADGRKQDHPPPNTPPCSCSTISAAHSLNFTGRHDGRSSLAAPT